MDRSCFSRNTHQAQRVSGSFQEKEPVSAFKAENVSQHEDEVALSHGTFASAVHTLHQSASVCLHQAG